MKRISLKRIVVSPSKRQGNFMRLSATGQIVLSPAFVEQQGLKKGDTAAFFQDEEAPTKWYVGFGKHGDYVLGCSKKDNGRSLYFNNSALRDRILHSLDLPKKTVRLHISSEPYELEGAKLWQLNLRK